MGLILCPECQKEVSDKALACPNCGAPISQGQGNVPVATQPTVEANVETPQQKKVKKLRKIFLVLVAIWIAIAVISAGLGNGSGGSSTAKFEVVDGTDGITVTHDMFAMYLSGVIKNNTNKTYSYVQVTFNIYDADGVLLGTAMDNVNNLEGGGTWKFNAMGVGFDMDDAASYKLKEITGF